MNEGEIYQRLINIELVLTHQQRTIEDLNEVIINQGKELENLAQQHKQLKALLEEDIVKPLSEETPPPHY